MKLEGFVANAPLTVCVVCMPTLIEWDYEAKNPASIVARRGTQRIHYMYSTSATPSLMITSARAEATACDVHIDLTLTCLECTRGTCGHHKCPFGRQLDLLDLT